MNAKVSIVIPAYNAADYLAEAIDSALAQTYADVEIIVVNDGSKDDGATERVALSYGDKIRYFRKENGGSSSALNVGIEQMTGTWFSWLSHDDLYTPDKIEKQMRYMRELPIAEEDISKHIFFSASDRIDGNGNIIRTSNAAEAREMAEKVNGFSDNAYLIAEPTRYNFHGCSCLIHRDAFEKVGRFDEGLRLLNDVDMWFRLYANGYVVHYIPEALVKGRMHAKQVSRSIGFSYHNSEQDMFWARSLNWLRDNHPNDYELYVLFGRNAYLKTRNADGKAAFAIAASLHPKAKPGLLAKKVYYRLRAGVRAMGKKLYIMLKL